MKARTGRWWAVAASAAVVTATCVAPAVADSAATAGPELGQPVRSTSAQVDAAQAQSTSDELAGTALVASDPPKRDAVTAGYMGTLAPALRTPVGWTGSISPCNPGSESSASRTATLAAVNYMRTMVQLSKVSFDATAARSATKSALIFDANNALSHSPSQASFPRCWTSEGKAAAGKSNIALGIGGAKVVEAYMDETGGNTAAGHRRWILNPATTVMSSGSTSSANALTVLGLGTSSATKRPAWMEWPARGWFPQQLEPQGRWSLSSSDPKVKFDVAKVSVGRLSWDGKIARWHTVRKQPVVYGYGPNTLVFDVGGITGQTSTVPYARYRVTVSNIKRDGVTLKYSYQVNLYDPTKW